MATLIELLKQYFIERDNQDSLDLEVTNKQNSVDSAAAILASNNSDLTSAKQAALDNKANIVSLETQIKSHPDYISEPSVEVEPKEEVSESALNSSFAPEPSVVEESSEDDKGN